MNDRNGYVTAAIPWIIRQGEFMYAHLTGTSLPILTRPHTSYAHVLSTAVGTRCKKRVHASDKMSHLRSSLVAFVDQCLVRLVARTAELRRCHLRVTFDPSDLSEAVEAQLNGVQSDLHRASLPFQHERAKNTDPATA